MGYYQIFGLDKENESVGDKKIIGEIVNSRAKL